MERVRLSKAERAILKELYRGNSDVPVGVDCFSYVDAIISLWDKRFIVAYIDGGDVTSVHLTAKGQAYITGNPHLYNPINWSMLAAIGTLATAITTLLALFIGCQMIDK